MVQLICLTFDRHIAGEDFDRNLGLSNIDFGTYVSPSSNASPHKTHTIIFISICIRKVGMFVLLWLSAIATQYDVLGTPNLLVCSKSRDHETDGLMELTCND